MTKAQQNAQEVFKRFPNAKEVYVTPDGQAFLAKDRAALHNKDYEIVLRSEVNLEDTAADTDTSKGESGVKKLAADQIAAAEAATTSEELDAIATGETRTTVLKAVEARRTELTTNTGN